MILVHSFSSVFLFGTQLRHSYDYCFVYNSCLDFSHFSFILFVLHSVLHLRLSSRDHDVPFLGSMSVRSSFNKGLCGSACSELVLSGYPHLAFIFYYNIIINDFFKCFGICMTSFPFSLIYSLLCHFTHIFFLSHVFQKHLVMHVL